MCGAFHQSFVCELGGDGGMRKGHRPIHTEFAKQGGGRERKGVRVRERERKGQHVGKQELMFREGICLGYYCNCEWRWDYDRLG